jgi:hypothetical protein
MIYPEADLDRLCWHDCHIWGIELRAGDPDDGDWTSTGDPFHDEIDVEHEIATSPSTPSRAGLRVRRLAPRSSSTRAISTTP